MSRTMEFGRDTSESRVAGSLNLDGSGRADVATGLGFLDHMLASMAKHARFDLELRAEGDIDVDDHHTAEDCAIALGRCLDELLGGRVGIRRFGFAYVPLDESLCRAVVDLSGRPWPEVHIPFTRPVLGGVATENLIHFFNSLAMEARMSLHIDVLRGENNHHIAESAFKATGVALASAAEIVGAGVPSTKGSLR